MAVMGAIPPPPGVTPNFINPEQKGQSIVVLGILGLSCSTLFLLMRIYTKLHINRAFASEDVCVILAWVFSVPTVVMILLSFKDKREGVHIWNVTAENFKASQKGVLATSVIYVPCLGLAKTSILLIFRRVFANRNVRFAIHSVLAVVVSYSIVIIVCLIFPCRPIARNWDISIPGSCINRPAVYVATAVMNIVTDLAILIIPIPMVVKLKIPLQQKIGLTGMFAVGSLTFITSVIRLVTLRPLFTSFDQSWVITTPAIWIVVEANLVIICCCFLALKSFLRHHAPSVIGEKPSSYKVTSAYEDRHRAPRGLVITKDVDFNLSWQDDSRTRISEYPTTNGSTGAYVEMDPMKGIPAAGTNPHSRTTEEKSSSGTDKISPPPPVAGGVKWVAPTSAV